MNCSQIRAQLSAWLDGEMATADALVIETHLAACADCRRESEALKQVRQALDTVPVATAEVDLSLLYRVATEAQDRRARRWRRGACALGSLAAALALFAVLPALEIRLDRQQFVARWGTPPPTVPPAVAPVPPLAVERTAIVSTTAPDVEERLRLLGDLVQMLADDAGKRDERRRRDLESLRAQINDLREQGRVWRQSTERDVAALYASQFPQTRKGQ